MFANGPYRIVKTADGWRWEGPRGGRETYDTNGRMLFYGDRTGIIGKLIYETGANGRLIGIADRNDRRVLWYGYNSDNRLSSVRDLDNRRVEYTWENANLAKIKDATNKETTHTYDAKGRMTQTADAEGRGSTVSYDEVGNLTRKQIGRAHV